MEIIKKMINELESIKQEIIKNPLLNENVIPSLDCMVRRNITEDFSITIHSGIMLNDDRISYNFDRGSELYIGDKEDNVFLKLVADGKEKTRPEQIQLFIDTLKKEVNGKNLIELFRNELDNVEVQVESKYWSRIQMDDDSVLFNMGVDEDEDLWLQINWKIPDESLLNEPEEFLHISLYCGREELLKIHYNGRSFEDNLNLFRTYIDKILQKGE